MIKNSIAIGLLFICSICLADDIKPLPQFTGEDRILIMAPHPDDEAIGAGGVIQKALKAGAKVKILYFTNGDHNELAFIVYEKRLVIRRGEFVHMGEVRRKESISAMKYLGLKEEDLIFLGYPDFGTLEIFTKYWQTTRPFKDVLTRISEVPYKECMSAGASYVGENILKDIEKVIADFRPTKIFASHPTDVNRDHRALYLFLQVALWDLEKTVPRPECFPYLIHVVDWPIPRGFHPDLILEPPQELKGNGIFWRELKLGEEEVNTKNQAITFYKSQIEAAPPYLFSFARKNELFGDYPAIKIERQQTETIQWQQIGRYPPSFCISSISFAQKDSDLFIKLSLTRHIDESFGASVFLAGYGRNKDFAAMPKIAIDIGPEGLHVKDKKRVLFVNKIQLSREGKTLFLRIPLSLLGDPDYLLAHFETTSKGLPLDDTSWRIIAIN